MERREFRERLVTLPLIVNGALFTLSIVILQNLLTSNNLSAWQLASLISFAVALPCLAGYAYIIFFIQSARVDPQARGKVFLWLQPIGIISDVLGILASLMNVSWVAGIAFLVTSIAVLVICLRTQNHIVELHNEVYPEEKK